MASTRVGFAVLVLALVLAASSLLPQLKGVSAQSLVPLGKTDKQAILDVHNALRARTARGETRGQPSAADMMLLEWDDRLMNKAAVWAATCVPGHDTLGQRLIPGHTWVGQNWAGGDTQNMSYFVQLWFDEYKDFTYKGSVCVPGKMCGHYTQVVWAKSQLLGCASAKCTDNPRTLVCNYATGGNMGDLPPYISGTPGSQCAGEFSFTDGIVCLRKDQCKANGGCRCALQCLNGGTLDATYCKCACTPNFYGFRCELPCEDTESLRDICPTDPNACKEPILCPKTCGLCVVINVGDKNAVNSDGVEARIPGR